MDDSSPVPLTAHLLRNYTSPVVIAEPVVLTQNVTFDWYNSTLILPANKKVLAVVRILSVTECSFTLV
jgi:hypothetical protein